MPFKLHILLFFFPFIAFGQILPSRPATALNTVTLYPDSSFFKHSSIVYEEGVLFDVLGETRFEHEDASQNQKFKWFYVQTPDQKQGWIYGDGLAVLQPLSEVKGALKNYHQKALNNTGTQEKLIAWMAAIEGKDNFHEADHLNPLYKEQYLVLTSPLRKSVHIQLSGQSAMGISTLQQLRFTDINEDGTMEIIVVRSSMDNNSSLEGRTVEIYAFQAGSIAKVFEDRLTLTYQGNQPSPALFKKIYIGEKTIRVAYVDYVACDNYRLSLETNTISTTQERCMEYVTYSHLWSAEQQRYQPLYEETRTYLTGTLNDKKGCALRREPSFLGEVVEKLPPDAPLTIIKQYEKIIQQKGKKKVIPYLYVQTANGNYGYLHADKVQFQNTEHGSLLSAYYAAPPLLKADWTSKDTFVIFKKDLEQAVTGRK